MSGERIGFLGLGTMGAAMAANLARAGFAVTAWNRSPGRAPELDDLGIGRAATPAEVAGIADIVVVCVSDTPDVESVLFGKDGIQQGLRKGHVVIDMSTISPSATRSFAQRLKELDVEMLDAPVTGGEKGAIEGTLAIMVGGRRETFDRCLPVFEALGKTIVYAGGNGAGQKTKLVNQILCAQHIVAMVDGLRFARLSGLDLDATLRIVSSGAAGSWMLSNLAPRILKDDFAPGFTIKLQQKDLRLVREAIEETGAPFPAAELTYGLFTEAVEAGLGEQGTQGMINLFTDKVGRSS